MKNVIGTPARGENYFPRIREITKILDCLQADQNLQIPAPRRIGKTSILWHLLDNNLEKNIYVYTDTEHIDSQQAFYKKLLKEVLANEKINQSPTLRKLLKAGTGILNKIKSIKILGNGLDFHDEENNVDYYQELTEFLVALPLDDHRKLVLLLDEFPQTILNIIESGNGNLIEARRFLQSNRDLRLNPAIHSKVRFIYTGSIGLNHTVGSINASAFINDLNTVEVTGLTAMEAENFLLQLLKDEQVNAECIRYLIQKVEWLIPFHLQLIVQEIISIAREKKCPVTEKTIDEAFEKIISARNNNHFRHYQDRLKVQLSGKGLKYAEDILSRIAAGECLNKIALADISLKYNLDENYRNIIDMLEYDGYITAGDQGDFHFISPILSLWWHKAA